MSEIKRLELAVHLFDDINFRGNYPYTKHHNNYTEENEEQMLNKYINKIHDIAQDPESYLLFVSHSPITRDKLHPNVQEVYMHVLENLYERHNAFQGCVDISTINKLKKNISDDVVLSAWGEYTSGCVLDDLLRVRVALGKEIDYNTVVDELCPRSGVDFDYPRPWENPINPEEKIKKYLNNIQEQIRYFTGEKNCMFVE